MRPFVSPTFYDSSLTIAGTLNLTDTSTATSGHLVYLAYTATSGSTLKYTRKTLTDSSGGYTFNNVKPGNYQIVADTKPYDQVSPSDPKIVTSADNISVTDTEIKLGISNSAQTPSLGAIAAIGLGNSIFSLGDIWLDNAPTVSIISSTGATPTRAASAWCKMTFPVKKRGFGNDQRDANRYSIALNLGAISLSQIVISDVGAGYVLRNEQPPPVYNYFAQLNNANVISVDIWGGQYSTTSTVMLAGIANGSLVPSPSGETVTVDEGGIQKTLNLLYAVSITPLNEILSNVIGADSYEQLYQYERDLSYYNAYDGNGGGRGWRCIVSDNTKNWNSKPAGSTGWQLQPPQYRLPYVRTGTSNQNSGVPVALRFNVKPATARLSNPAKYYDEFGSMDATSKIVDALKNIWSGISANPYDFAGKYTGVKDGAPLYFDIVHTRGEAALAAGEFGTPGSPEATWNFDLVKGYIGRELLVRAAAEGVSGSYLSSIFDIIAATNTNPSVLDLINPLRNFAMGSELVVGFLANTVYQMQQAWGESDTASAIPGNILKELKSLGRQTVGTGMATPPDWLVGKSFSGTLSNGSTVNYTFNSGGYNRTVTP